MFVDGPNVARDKGFQPALRSEAEEEVGVRAAGMALFGNAPHQFAEQRVAALVQNVLCRADAEEDGFSVTERTGDRRYAGTREFQSIEAEDNFRR